MLNRKNIKFLSSIKGKFKIILIILVSSCSHYKSSWDCANPRGLGCTSIAYADEVARRHIILNDSKMKLSATVLINERYTDFKKQKAKEVN